MSQPIILRDAHFKCPTSFSLNSEERLPVALVFSAIATLIPSVYSKLSSRGVFWIRTFAAASLIARVASYGIGYIIHPATTFNKSSEVVLVGERKTSRSELADYMYQISKDTLASNSVAASWQRVKLERNGVVYDALSIKRDGFKEGDPNELWTLKTYGNGDFYELHISEGDDFGKRKGV